MKYFYKNNLLRPLREAITGFVYENMLTVATPYLSQ